jgi:hypothetical protein
MSKERCQYLTMSLKPISSSWTDSFQHRLEITVFWNIMSCNVVCLHVAVGSFERLAPLCHTFFFFSFFGWGETVFIWYVGH